MCAYRARARFSDYLSPTDLLSGVARTLRKVRCCFAHFIRSRLTKPRRRAQERGHFWLFYPYLLADRFVSDAAQHNLRLRCTLCADSGVTAVKN